MKKSQRTIYPFETYVDNWNPHIVRNINESEEAEKVGTFAKDEKDIKEYVGNVKDFKSLWHAAQKALGKHKKGFYPLAYRLDPKLSDVLKNDPIEGSKFGGMPDFRHHYNFSVNPEKKKIDELIEKEWPKCQVCNDHMNFLGGVDLSGWIVAIHNITQDIYGASGLGHKDKIKPESWPFHKQFWNIFYCKTPHFDNFGPDAKILSAYKYEDTKDKMFSIGKYVEAISEFVEKNKIQSNVSIQKVRGVRLRFDLDIPQKEYLDDKELEKIIESNPYIFKSESPYQFFGVPHSQQTSKRYFCQNPFFPAHRMSPIVNWTDEDIDFTYQINSCLKCEDNYRLNAKTDGSCT